MGRGGHVYKSFLRGVVLRQEVASYEVLAETGGGGDQRQV